VLANDEDVSKYLATEGATSHKGTDIVVPTLKGSNLVVVDIAPGGQSQMHRTLSIDYSICVIGHVRMELDNGEFLDLRPGDHVIQRGTMHKWWNGSQTEAARFVAVTLPCESFELPGLGKMLKEEHVEGSGAPQNDGSKL
jgi:quercetin dioxygenase-like cupin family protein